MKHLKPIVTDFGKVYQDLLAKIHACEPGSVERDVYEKQLAEHIKANARRER